MNNITLIGIDLGKHTFHIHCQDKSGKALPHKKFTRTQLMAFLANCPSATVVMEACAGAHFMVGRINDFIDAEATCEAASRPSIRFVQPRTEAQQA